MEVLPTFCLPQRLTRLRFGETDFITVHLSSRTRGEHNASARMDQGSSDLRNGTAPDHSMARLHCYGLPFSLQCNPRSHNVGKNQGHHFHLSLDDEVSHFERSRRGEERPKDFQIVIYHGHEGRIPFETRCPIVITDR